MNLKNNKLSPAACLTLIAGALAIPAQADLLVRFVDNNLGQVNVSWSGSFDTNTEPSEIGAEFRLVDASTWPLFGLFSSGLDASQINRWDLASPGNLIFGGGVFPISIDSPLQSDGFYIGEGSLFVGSDYTSGASLSGASSLPGSFDSLGMEAGSYSTSATTGDTITFEVSFSDVSPIPEVSGSAILSGILLMSAFGRRRKT